MNKYIDKLGNYKINVTSLDESERTQLYCSIVYLGLYRNSDWTRLILGYNYPNRMYFSKMTGFWYVYGRGEITNSRTNIPGYFERHKNIEIKPEDILIKDIIFKDIDDIPTGMYIRTTKDYSCIKSRYGYLKYKDTGCGFVGTGVMYLFNKYGLYSKSLNPIMVENFFKGN